MIETQHADLIVIGAGPGGYAAAFRAADLGRSVVLVDGRSTLGGVCLNEGCIPSKALLHAARVIHEASHIGAWGISFGHPKTDIDALRARKDAIVSQLTDGLGQLARRRKVRVVTGRAAFVRDDELAVTIADGGIERWTFGQAIIAAGSSSMQLPGWPQDSRIWDSTAALELRFVPRRLAIVGGGIIGLEMATIYSALGSSVTVIELAGQVAPGAEADAADLINASLEARSCIVHTGTRVISIKASAKSVRLSCEGGYAGTVEADAVIQAVGRRASTAAIAAVKAGIEVRPDGAVIVDALCRTNRYNIFAVGDITGGPMLAHRATHQGKVAAEVACGHASAFDTAFVPFVAYTNPELAWVGPTTAQLKAAGVAHKVARFPWAASGRNLASGGGDGLTMIAYAPESGRVLGATIVGPGAGELLAEVGLALEMGATLTDLALTVHAHPTLSETVAFATERALGRLAEL
ncbi:dihydrolipoyl dehydrogenase [Mesorhizobium newzealandense]|uniref:Dihydrolipoyl dehydrogenase n=2 Tax=Mesorhizobium TaxID=68287 RepID=A0ABW4U4I7_9HYPH